MKRSAFTLIELLIVISVIGVLASMLMPIVTIAGRMARVSATRAVMVKADSALRLFRNDVGSYPWQQSYADLSAGEPATNRLYYHIGTDIALTDLINVRTDADAAGALYNYDARVGAPPASPYAFIPQDCGSTGAVRGGPVPMVNRMGAERARLAIFAGNVSVTGCILRTPYSFARRVISTAPLLAAPASAAKAGWAKDYVQGEIEGKYIDGETLLDAWRRPMIYVGQIVEGMQATPAYHFFGYALGYNGQYVVNALDYGLHPLGRRTLAEFDAITREPLAVHATYLPDLGNLRHSDRRFYAAPGNELEFELWSAGPDGRADWMRDAPANVDNVALTAYDLRIP